MAEHDADPKVILADKGYDSDAIGLSSVQVEASQLHLSQPIR